MTNRLTYVIELRPEGPDKPIGPEYRLKRALKVLLRAFRLRCVSVEEKKTGVKK